MGKWTCDDESVLVLDEDGYKRAVPSDWGRIEPHFGIESRSAGCPYGWMMIDKKREASLLGKFVGMGVVPAETIDRLFHSAAKAAQMGYDQDDPDTGNAGLMVLARISKTVHDAAIAARLADQEASHLDSTRLVEGEFAYVKPPESEAREILALANQFGILPKLPVSDDTTLET